MERLPRKIDCHDAAERFDWLLDEVQTRGVSFEVYQDGKPIIRIVPPSPKDWSSVTEER